MKIIYQKTIFLVLILFLLLVVISNGCSSSKSNSICGNKIAEPGEVCDGAGCPADKVCTEKCKCETFSPPKLPEG